MCNDPKSTASNFRTITKEDALAYLEWLKNGGRDVLADHIFVDNFKEKTSKEDSSK